MGLKTILEHQNVLVLIKIVNTNCRGHQMGNNHILLQDQTQKGGTTGSKKFTIFISQNEKAPLPRG
jgi:hypothetical protein